MPLCEPETIDEVFRAPRKERELSVKAPPAAPPAVRRRRHFPWLFAVLLAVVGAAALVAVCVAAGIQLPGVAAAPIRLETMTFEFQAVPREDHLLLTWDPSAKAVRNAAGATLSIHDGPESEDAKLDLDTLRRGGVDYYPVFENASFRLTLTQTPGGSVSEAAHASLRP